MFTATLATTQDNGNIGFGSSAALLVGIQLTGRSWMHQKVGIWTVTLPAKWIGPLRGTRFDV